jgi:hypothetical protein
MRAAGSARRSPRLTLRLLDDRCLSFPKILRHDSRKWMIANIAPDDALILPWLSARPQGAH